ncbi:MAG: hypothetical protein NC219_00040 [Prevotella sp.]|nr:hypothetical protein [Prevotella sp.]
MSFSLMMSVEVPSAFWVRFGCGGVSSSAGPEHPPPAKPAAKTKTMQFFS